MIKVILILVAVVLTTSLSIACSEEEEPGTSIGETAEATTDGEAEEPTETAEPTETPEPDLLNLTLGQTANIGDADVTAHSFRIAQGDEFFGPSEGNTWLVVDVTLVNTGDDPYNLSSLLQTAVRDAEGREYDVTIGPDTQGSFDGSIPAGDQIRGEVGFEVPANTPNLQFVFKQAFGDEQARWNLQ